MADDKAKYYDKVFPSPIAPDDEKQTKAYGRAVARAIYGSFVDGDNSYYTRRNEIIAANRILASGKQDISEYLKVMDIDSDTAFVNLKHHPRPIAPKFRDILVNSIMDKTERVKCKGLSLDINDRKEQKVLDAAFRMKEGKFVKEVQDQSGIQLEDDQAFTPESEEELDIWKSLNDQEHEELLMAEGINFVFNNNQWELEKKALAESAVDTGFLFARNYFDANKRIIAKVIRPEQMVYSSTNTLTFDKGSYIGHVESMTIADLRLMWTGIDEEKLWKIAKSNYGQHGNTSPHGEWSPLFNNAYNRPYDGYTIEVLMFEYRVTKFKKILKSKDKNGKTIVEYPKPNYDAAGQRADDKKLINQPIPCIYSGAWVIGTDMLPEWGEQSDQLRNNENFNDVAFTYTGYMLNNDGTMLPSAPIGAMKSSIFQMELAILKMQQHLATIAPDGVRIDVDSAVDIDLGKGMGEIGYMTLKKIRQQTGDEFWSSKKLSGENNNRPAIEQAIHNMGDKIAQFINVYNFELNNIRDYISVNEVRDGSSVNPRMGMNVMNNQIQASNTGTAHIYLGYIYVYGRTATSVGIRLWDTLKQAEPNSMYMRILGNENVQFIRKRKILTASNYDVLVSVDMSDEDKNFLDRTIESSLQAGSIEFEDAVYVRKIANLDLAIRYLTFAKKKRAKEARDHQIQIDQANQQNAAALAQQQAAQKQEAQMELDKIEMAKNAAKADLDHKMQIQKLISDSLLLSMDPAMKEIPPYVQVLIDEQIAQDKKRMDAEAQAEAEQQQAEQEQQANEMQMQPVE